jgi:hypothetical protein
MTSIEKLQLTELPSEDEICRCDGQARVLLRYQFSEFPVSCMECVGQMMPSAFELKEELAMALVRWRTTYAALYDLWLSSGDYEAWARAALLDPIGEVNREGLALARELSEQRATYYWWFEDTETPSIGGCPVCGGELTPHALRQFRLCERCGIAI